jgi:hypothetical protein
MTVKGRDDAAMKESVGLEAKLEATALGYLRVFRKTDEHGLGATNYWGGLTL